MKRKYLYILLVMMMLFTITSCKGKKYNDMASFTKNLIEYKNEVTRVEFDKLNKTLKDHKTHHPAKDLIVTTNNYKFTDSVGDMTEDDKTIVKKEEISTYIQRVDYSNKLIQESRTTTTNEVSDLSFVNNETKTTELEEYSYQMNNGKMIFVEKLDFTGTYLLQDWNYIAGNTYIQDKFMIFGFEKTDKFYIDDNVYTVVSKIKIGTEEEEKVRQVVINEDNLTYLEIIKKSEQVDSLLFTTNSKIQEATYIKGSFAEQNLKPFDISNFTIKDLGEF